MHACAPSHALHAAWSARALAVSAQPHRASHKVVGNHSLQRTRAFGYRVLGGCQNVSTRRPVTLRRAHVRVNAMQAGTPDDLPRYIPEQPEKDLSQLQVGSVVVVTEMPEFVKTSNAMSALRVAEDVISLGEPGKYVRSARFECLPASLHLSSLSRLC
eukprot:7832856-Pyramimonas_sp.AAC.1